MPSSNRNSITPPTTAWSLNWLLNNNAGQGMDDLGFSPWQQGIVADANAVARLTQLGFSAWQRGIVADVNAAARLNQLGVSAYMQTVLPEATALDARAALGAARLTLFDVRDYGAAGNGVADDTAAVQAAITAASVAGGIVFLPVGTYLVTSTLLVAANRVHIVGCGPWASVIHFSPTANDTCLEFQNGVVHTLYCSVESLSLYAATETWEMVAIEMVYADTCTIRDVVIGGAAVRNGAQSWADVGDASTALLIRGHAIGLVEHCRFAANRPIVIGQNPHLATIDIDHWRFSTLSLTAHLHPVVEILDGVILFDVVFDGPQAWNQGTHGLYWLDTSSAQVGHGLRLENIRWEQGTDATAYLVRIQHNYAFYRVFIKNCHGGGDGRNGFYFRKCRNVSMDTNYYTGGAGKVCLDVDATVQCNIQAQNCFWGANSTANIVGQRCLTATPKLQTNDPLPPNFVLGESSNVFRNMTFGGAIGEEVVSLADAATADIALNQAVGLLLIACSIGASAIYVLKGAGNATAEVADPDNLYTVTPANAGTTNIFWNGGTSRYRIENRTGNPQTYRFSLIGGYVTF